MPLPKILAIDDTPANLLTLGAALEGEFDLQFATSGPFGMELALRSVPDLILLDVMMPEVDGFETFRRLSAHATLQHVPVIFITALHNFDSEVKGLSLGAADYITKPINVAIARQRIRNLLERESLRKEVQWQAQSLRQLGKAVEQSPASVIITHLDGCIEYLNPRFTEITGYSADEMLGKNPRILQSGLTPRSIYAEMWGQLVQGQPWAGEFINKRKNGELFWEDAQIAPVKDANGVVTHYVAVATDITARKQAEFKMQAMNDQMSAILAGIPIPFFVKDAQSRFVVVNAACEAQWGLRQEDLLGTDGSAFFPAEQMASFLVKDQEIFAQGQALDCEELVWNAADQQNRTYHTYKNPSFDAAGKPLYLACASIDITKRKAAERELVRYQSQLEAKVLDRTHALQISVSTAERALNTLSRQKLVLDQHAIVTMSDLAGRITYSNDRFSEISGYTQQEALGQDHSLVNSGQHPQGFFKAMYQTIARGDVWRAEVCNRAKNGHLYWVDSTIAAFMGPDGKPLEYIAVRTDITERKTTEVLEKFHRRALAVLADNAPLDTMLASLAQELELAKPGLLCSILYPGMRDLDQGNERAARTHLGDRWSVPIVAASGLVLGALSVFSSTTYSPQASDILLIKQAAHLVGVAIERSDAQCALVYSEARAQAATLAKSAFLSNMSHEIRTPMNGVVGMLDVLQQTPLLPDQRRMLETIHKSSLALLTILNDILDFSKIEAGMLDIETIPTHLREVAEGVIQLMLTVALSKDAQVFLLVDPDLPVWVFSDPTRLRQILFNLLGNALKFIAPAGLGQVALHLLAVTQADGLMGLQLRVKDNGIGMNQQVLAQLFQPFVQADASTAREFGGTGLGLSITQRLVSMMGGRISVLSTPGVGSEFIVDFALRPAPAPPERKPVRPVDLSGVQVLAVAPDAECANLLQVYLRAAGAQVQVVADLLVARSQWALSRDNTVLVLGLGTPWDTNPSPQSLLQGLADRRIVRLISRHSERATAPSPFMDVFASPLLYDELIATVGMASGLLDQADLLSISSLHQRGSPPSGTLTESAVRAPTIEQAVMSGQLILLAEDNETNRDVMQAQLGLLGYAAEFAEDGVQALAMWRSGRYALLLTDCHMPHMDGFELTEAIRQAEPVGTRLPIVAITANAMQGAAERCRVHGMDDYLSKPLRLSEIAPMLAKWMPRTTEIGAATLVPAMESASALPERPPSLPIWDAHALSELVGDDPVMHKRLYEKFLLNANKQVAAIGVALAGARYDVAADVAHVLKSAARSVGALELGELCEQLETSGCDDDGAACAQWAADLQPAFIEVEAAIQRHLAQAGR